MEIPVAQEKNPALDLASQEPTSVRHKVLAFGVALAAITYLDRVCISITAPLMMRDLGLNTLQMSLVFSAFTFAYGLFEIPTGWWGDRVGTRKVLTRIVVWWSSFTMATAAAFNFPSLVAIRFLFGMGEAGAWPNAAKTFSRWFPLSERGTAQGIFFMGAHLGGGVTPILVTALLTRMPWRGVFLLFGAVGFFWAFTWYRWFRDDPAQHSAVNRKELEHICRGRAPEADHRRGVPWKHILVNRSLIALCLMYFTQSYGFYFYITWLPTYLEKVRGFKATNLGLLAGMPLALSVLADLFGGLTTDWVTRRYGLRLGRCGVGGASLLLAGLFIMVGASTENAWLSALLISFAAASGNFLLGACWGVCIDIAGSHAGVVSACMNTAGQVGGVLSPIILALVVENYSNWAAPLYFSGMLYLGGALCWLFIDPSRPILSEAKPQ